MDRTLRWVAPFPWREAAHLAVGLFAGIGLLGALALVVVSAPLLVFVPGLAVGAMKLLLRLGRVESGRYGALLAAKLAWRSPQQPSGDARARWRALVGSAEFRRLAAYALVRAPLSLLQMAAFTAVFTWPLMLLTSAARAAGWGRYPASGPFVGGSWAMLAVGLSTAVLLVTVVTVAGPWLIRELTRLDLVIAESLLIAPDTDLVERAGELVESRNRVLSAAEAERARIERDLHDGAQQRLIALGVTLGRAEHRLRRQDPDGDVLRLVSEAKAETLGVVSDIRSLAQGLRPAVLESRGLDASLSAVAAGLGIPVDVVVADERLGPQIESALYFAIAECLTNVAKHAPRASAAVSVTRQGDVIHAEVRDDGPGGADLANGTGLAGLADRLAGLDGRLWLSSPEGGPTVVRMEVPCAS